MNEAFEILSDLAGNKTVLETAWAFFSTPFAKTESIEEAIEKNLSAGYAGIHISKVVEDESPSGHCCSPGQWFPSIQFTFATNDGAPIGFIEFRSDRLVSIGAFA